MPPTSRTSLEEQQSRLGLRERKKLRTRTEIRRATYALIAEQGYEATTVEQIAEASEVSPSTVFRYFPTKEDIVLTDEYDPIMAAVLRARPADEPPLKSLRHLLVETLAEVLDTDSAEMIQRSKLMVAVPSVRARMTETMSVTARLLSDVLAERSGRDPNDLRLRVFTAAVLGALCEVSLYWAERDCQDDLLALLSDAFDSLEGGLSI